METQNSKVFKIADELGPQKKFPEHAKLPACFFGFVGIIGKKLNQSSKCKLSLQRQSFNVGNLN